MLVTTLGQFEEAVSYLNARPDDRITCDTETTGKDWRGNKICGVPLHRGDRSFYFAFRHKEGPNLPLPLLKRLFAEVIRPDRPQTWHHYSYDGKVAAHHDGIPLVPPSALRDTLLGALVMNENEESFKLEDLTAKYVNKDAAAEETELVELICQRFGGSKKEAKGKLWMLPAEMVAPYGERDVWSTSGLDDFYSPHLETWKLTEPWRELCEYQIYVMEMELRGVLIDRETHQRLKLEAEVRAQELLARLKELAGYPINPNSPPQVRAWLKVKSSNKQTLSRLGEDERVELIQEARQWLKAGNTYYEPYSHFCDPEGVLRCNLHLTSPGVKYRNKSDSRNGTISGRMSSSKPNLQQIPRESDTYKVKELFVARPGHVLIELDYSQAELRIAAHYSRDERLTEILLSGGDMHGIVSTEMDVPRSIAKNMNFSAWYGIGYRTFARNYYLPESKAKDYLTRYHRMFPGIRRLSNAMTARAEKQGFIRLFHGRIRRYNCEEAPTYTASNNLIQGSVAGMMQRAGIRIRKEVPGANLLLQVHDAYWLEPRIEDAPRVLRDARRIMQDQPWCTMPMLVDAKMSRTSLGAAEKVPRTPLGVPVEALSRTIAWWEKNGFEGEPDIAF